MFPLFCPTPVNNNFLHFFSDFWDELLLFIVGPLSSSPPLPSQHFSCRALQPSPGAHRYGQSTGNPELDPLFDPWGVQCSHSTPHAQRHHPALIQYYSATARPFPPRASTHCPTRRIELTITMSPNSQTNTLIY